MVSDCLNQWKFVQGHISCLEWSWNTITVLLSTNQILSRLTKRVELEMVSVTLGNQKGANENEEKSFKYKALFWKEDRICFHCPVAGFNTKALNSWHLCEIFRSSGSYMWILGGKNHHAGITWQGRVTKGNCSAVKAKRIYKVTLFYSSYWSFPLSDPTETCAHRHQRHLRDGDFCWSDLVEKREWDWTRNDRQLSLHSVFGEASFLRLLVGLLCHQASVGILTCFYFGNLLRLSNSKWI